MKTLFRLFSFLFHGVLALFLIAVSLFALTSGNPSLDLKMLPWTGATLADVVLASAVFGLIALFLAARSKARFLFLLWSLAVAVMLVRGYIFSPYHFQPGGVSTAAWLTIGSLAALLGAWFQMLTPTRRFKY